MMRGQTVRNVLDDGNKSSKALISLKVQVFKYKVVEDCCPA